MSKEMNVFNPAGPLSAEMASVFDVSELAGDLSDGASSGGFQTVSIRGSKWRIKSGGEEYNILNADGEAIPSIEVVMLKANKGVSKLYYDKKYTEGDDEAPTCMSADGIKPDASSTKKQSANCATCKWNQWGSRITEAGKKAKVCADTRRMAVWVHTPMPDGTDDSEPVLLRIPAASLADLATFGQNMARKNYPYNALVTRLGFDVSASYPKLTFKAVRPISPEEAETVVKMVMSDTTTNILNTVHESAPAGTSVAEEVEEEEEVVEVKTVDTDFEIPDAAPAKAKAKKEPAEKAKPAKQTKAEPEPEDDDTDSSSMDDELDSIISDLESLS